MAEDPVELALVRQAIRPPKRRVFAVSGMTAQWSGCGTTRTCGHSPLQEPKQELIEFVCNGGRDYSGA